MQIVSTDYKKDIKSPFRNQGHMEVMLGVINKNAQSHSIVDTATITKLCKNFTNNIFTNRKLTPNYAAFEEDYIKLNGYMRFVPTSEDLYQDDGVSAITNTIKVIVKPSMSTIKGLTIDFGENPPLEFNINNQVFVKNNTDRVWSTEEVFHEVSSLIITATKMKSEHSRLRISNLKLGYGIVYTNEDILESVLNEYISPISSEIFQSDLSLTVKNHNNTFNIDNPNSPIHFITNDSCMSMRYGYTLNNGEIEWLSDRVLYCSECENTISTVTFRAHDVYRTFNKKYTYGVVNKISYFDLAKSVLETEGCSDYSIDPCLKYKYTNNPLPILNTKEALQIIANACKCVLYHDKNGKVQIKNNFSIKLQASNNKYSQPFSKTQAVLENTQKEEYAIFAKDYITLDSTKFFVPKNNDYKLNTGYISTCSNDDGRFLGRDVPILKLKFNVAKKCSNLKIQFGSIVPYKLMIFTYLQNNKVESFAVNNLNTITLITRDFKECDEIHIWCKITKKSNQPVVINFVSVDDSTGFTMTNDDMLSSPKLTKKENVKNVVVPYYTYCRTNDTAELTTDTIETTKNQEEEFFISEPAFNYICKLNSSSDGVEIIKQGAYYLKVRYKKAGKYTRSITYHKYKVISQSVSANVSSIGKTIYWDNPLISSKTMAQELADWLKEYYMSQIEYEYDTRGFPELECLDTITQENTYVQDLKAVICKTQLQFNGAWKGNLITRRKHNE